MFKDKGKQRRADLSGVQVWSWGIETLLQPGFLHYVVNLLEGYRVDMCSFQETRWQGCVLFPLCGGWVFANIGGDSRCDEIAALVSPRMWKSILGIKFAAPPGKSLLNLTSSSSPVFAASKLLA